MIIIFDTYGGLCNQFYDIICGVNFCIINNISFSFRYASFRNNDLMTWFNVEFEKLFDINFFKKFENFIEIQKLNLTNENTYNYYGYISIYQIIQDDQDIIGQLNNINKEFVVLKQFWSVHKFREIKNNFYSDILPSKKIMDAYLNIFTNLSLENNKYNFIHYRYELDFINYFKINELPSLPSLILNNCFKNKNLKIYIASTNIKNLLQNNNSYVDVNNLITFKDEETLSDFNFEEKAFIDFMFGLYSNEVYGHNKSSFSTILNNLKQTNNYYNL